MPLKGRHLLWKEKSSGNLEDEKSGNIFTKNFLLPRTVFKGEASRDTVIFLTRGGRVNDIVSTVSHTVQVSPNQNGIFLLHHSRAISNHYEISSYIERLTCDREFEAYFEGEHEKFSSWRLMREEVGLVCGKDVMIKRISSQELTVLDIPEFCVKLANPILDALNKKVTFDVKAKSNIAGLEFARADIPLKYPEELLGSNVVLNGKVEAVKAESTNTSFYDLNIHDIVDDKFMLTLSSSCNGGESGFVLGTEFEKIAKVTVEVQEYGDLGTINAESFDVDGFAKYFLDGACQEFIEKCVEGQIPLAICTISPIVTIPLSTGIGQQITFTGTNFGSSTIGSILIPNANDDGINTVVIPSSSNYVDLWNDTLIILNLSSIVDPTYNVSTTDILGSGTWTIVPGSTDLPCEIEIEIDYNLIATEVSMEYKTFSLAQTSSSNPTHTRNWYIIDSINSNPILDSLGITHQMVEDVAKAVFCDWEKATGINFSYKGTIDKAILGDDKYTISFSNFGGSATLMQTSTYPLVDVCDSAHLFFGGRIIDGDFEVNIDSTWFFNPTDTSGLAASNGYDFYSILLHEVGHSLGLEHSMDSFNNGVNDPSIMYYADPKGFMRRTIDNKSASGVEWLIDKTIFSTSTLNECFSVGYGISTSMAGDPCEPLSVESGIQKTSCNLVVNTLLTKGDNIDFKLNNKKPINIFLVDILGRIVFKDKIKNGDSISTSQLKGGMYFLFTNCENTSKAIKILIL